MLLKHPQTRVE
jgi:hypothetical protein